MNNFVEHSLQTAAAKTLEELCFLLPSQEVGESEASAPWEASVQVPFRGDLNGCILIHFFGPPARQLAAIMSPDVGESAADAQIAKDALGEVGNVLCGNILPLIAGTKAVICLGSPDVRQGDEDRLPEIPSPEGRVLMGLGSGRIEIVIGYSRGDKPHD